jgi:hypothetical protein
MVFRNAQGKQPFIPPKQVFNESKIVGVGATPKQGNI